MAKLLKHRAVVMAVVLLVLVTVLVISYRVSHKDSTPGDRSLALASPLTPDQLVKIDPELLAVIEREEEHSGKGQEVAPNNFVFDSSGRVECIVVLNPGKIVVTPSTTQGPPVSKQPAGQLIIRHGGEATSGLEHGNIVIGSMPLKNIKALAREDAVTEIFPGRWQPVPDRGPVTTATSVPPSTPDASAKIDPDLLAVIEWEEAYPGEGQEVAPDGFVFDDNGWVECVVVFDPNEISVTPMWTENKQWEDQAAVQLIVQYGGRVTMAYGHEVAGSIPLGQIKRLAQEDIVTSIFPNVLIRVPDRGPIVTATPSPPSPR